jgi:Flp pilus assembly protein TadD
VTLIITHLTRRRIFQSGDFRLTDRRTGDVFDYEAQKQVIVQRSGWTALVGFCGVAHTGHEPVPEWIVRQLRATPFDASFDDLLRRLKTAEVWLAGISPRFRGISFSVGAFVDFRPVFVLISNFEVVGRPPSPPPREYSAALELTRFRPRGDQLLLSGRPTAVSRDDRRWLRRVLVDATPEDGYSALADVNRRAAVRDSGVGVACFTSHATALGELGGTVHEWPGDQEYLPAFMDVNGIVLPRLRPDVDEHGQPVPIQVRGMSGAAFVESAEYFRLALAAKPTDPSTLTNYGNWLKKRGRRDQAETAYRTAIDSDDQFASAYGNLAILLDDRGDAEEAEDAYRRAVELDNDSTIYGTNLAYFMWRRLGDRASAHAQLLEIVGRQRDAFTVGRLAWFNDVAFDDHQDVAQQLYEEALGMAPQDMWLHGRYGEFLRRRGDTDGARTHFEQATTGESPDIDALLWYAGLQLQEGLFESGEQLLRRASRLRRRDPDLVAALAAARWLCGAADQDVEPMYRQALEWQPGQPLAGLNLAQILLRRDSRDEEAHRLLADVSSAELAPEMRLELLFYGLAYSVEGFEEAYVEMRRLLDEGVHVTRWDLAREVEAVREQGHAHSELLAEVIEFDS